jgi:hypothetical protein
MKAASQRPPAGVTDHEVRLDRLLGRQVLAGNNHTLGRLEEFRTQQQGNRCVIIEYVIGPIGLFERLGVGVKLLFGRQGSGYAARWDQLDITDPEHPRLRCPIEALRRL